MTTALSTPTRPAIVKYLTAGLIAGVIAAIVNNLYGFAFTAITGNSLELVGPVSITLASLIPLLVAAVGYYIVARFLPQRANVIFIVGTLVLAALSLGGPFASQLPDGSVPPTWFPTLTAPMHLIAGLVCAFGIPRLVNR
jgi:hypothetical protein